MPFVFIEEVKIRNMLSYSDCAFPLKQNNVVVGPNNSGKTNILRILAMLQNADRPGTVRLPAESRLDKGPSVLSVSISLTTDEPKMLEQSVFHDSLGTLEPSQEFSKIQVAMKWNAVEGANSELPAEVILRISNGFTVSNRHKKFVFYTDEIPAYGEPTVVPPPLTDRDVAYATYEKIHGIKPEQLFSKEGSETEVRKKPKPYFMVGEEEYCIPFRSELDSDMDTLAYSYLKINRSSGATITVFDLVAGLFRNCMSISGETPPSIRDMAGLLFEMKNAHEPDYEEVKSSFSKIFTGVTLEVRTSGNQEHSIMIHEHGGEFPISMSSSGYFATLCLLYQIHGKIGQSVFFDEPETHLHPNHVRKMASYIDNYRKNDKDGVAGSRHGRFDNRRERENQITIITHSPALVSRPLLRDGSRSLLYVRRDGKRSTVNTAREGFEMPVKANHFEPSIFFEKCVILVEGPSDEHAVKGLSDRREDVFGQNDIIVVNTGGKDHIQHHVSLLKEYGIPHVAMADSDYSGGMDGVIKLGGTLEDELRSHGWKSRAQKISADEAYTFTSEDMDEQEMVKCALYGVMEKAVQLAGGAVTQP